MKENYKIKAKYPMLIWVFIIVISVIIDRISKIVVVNNLELNQSIDIIKGIINFRYIRNEGAAWGMFSDNRWVFITVTIIALSIIPFFLYKYRRLHWMFGISLSVIIGGGIGNMIDRIIEGSVVDFIEFSFFQFPVFNFADICVTCGAFLLAFYIIFLDKTLLHDNPDKKSSNKTVVNVKENENINNKDNG